MIHWSVTERHPLLLPPRQVAFNLSQRRSSNISLNYRRSASQARGKEARNAYQKKRSKADRDTLRLLKETQPEAYEALLAQVRAQG